MSAIKSILPATELRKVQTEQTSVRKEERDKRDAEFAEKFRVALDKYYDILMEEVAHALDFAQKTSRTHIILDDKSKITADVDEFAYTSMLYGFWDNRKHRFNDSVFEKHGLTKPLARAHEELSKLGYKLEDVSDPKRSRRLFLKLSWGS